MEGSTLVSTIQKVKIENLTETLFHSYGNLIHCGDRPPDFKGIKAELWRTPFEVKGTTELGFIRYGFQQLRFTKLERHFNVTQSFIPLGNKPAIMVVAPSKDTVDGNIIPRPEEVRAFLIDGSAGITLKKAIWHALDRFPLSPPHIDFVLITSKETTDDLQRKENKLTQTVDYEERYGVSFELTW